MTSPHSFPIKSISLFWALLLLALPSSSLATGRAPALVQEYANQNGFQVKKIQAGGTTRPVNRLFVPVTPQSFAPFLKKFNINNGFAHISFAKQNNHIVMGLRPPGQDGKAQDCYLWARNYNGTVQGLGDSRRSYIHPNINPGYLIGVEYPAQKIQHLSNWLTQRASPQDALYRGGNCMEWFPNAEVAPGKALFHDLGIKRSRSGPNMKAKLIHAATAPVSVVGVYVPNAEAFNAMTNEQLLGPPPAGTTTQNLTDAIHQ